MLVEHVTLLFADPLRVHWWCTEFAVMYILVCTTCCRIMDPNSPCLLRFHGLTQHMTVPEIKISDNRYNMH